MIGLAKRQRSGASVSSAERSHTVGLILGNIANPFYSSLHRAVEDVAASHGSVVIAASLDEDAGRESLLISQLIERGVDGIILTPTSPSQRDLRPAVDAGLAVVCVDRPASGIELDVVLCDNFVASRRAVEHLMSFGHRKIAYLGDTNALWTARERERGFLKAISEAGITKPEFQVVTGLTDVLESREGALRLLTSSPRPTAIFSSQNLVTMGAIRALQEKGLNTQIALVGFDDFEASDLTRPAVTVMAQDAYRIGEIAAARMFARILGDRSPTTTEIVEAELIVRGSGELPPA